MLLAHTMFCHNEGFRAISVEPYFNHESRFTNHMQYIVFSKLLKNLSIDQLIDTLKSIGADGVDLCVRDGYPVNPGNARAELPKAATRIRDAGLAIPMISASTSLTDPS